MRALRDVVREAAPGLQERLKWGHLVYVGGGPVLLIRAEQHRLLFGFWRGKRLLHIEPRMTGGGKYELRTLDLRPGTPLAWSTALALAGRRRPAGRGTGRRDGAGVENASVRRRTADHQDESPESPP
ncbi:MAG TPA: DUF1801 domain-containing protein [Roseateles sp.]